MLRCFFVGSDRWEACMHRNYWQRFVAPFSHGLVISSRHFGAFFDENFLAKNDLLEEVSSVYLSCGEELNFGRS